MRLKRNPFFSMVQIVSEGALDIHSGRARCGCHVTWGGLHYGCHVTGGASAVAAM